MRLLINKKYLEMSLYVIFTVISIYSLIVIINSSLFIITNFKSVVTSIFSTLKYFIKLFSNVIVAFIISYMLDPLVNFFQKYYDIIKIKFKFIYNKKNIQNKNITIKKRTEGTILTYIFIFIIFIIFFSILLDSLDLDNNNLKNSIIYKFNNLLEQFNDITTNLVKLLKEVNLPKSINKSIENLTLYFDNLGNKVFMYIIKYISSFSIDIINFIFSIIVAFYIMENKYGIKKAINEFVNLFFSEKVKKIIKSFCKDVDYVLSGYIKCQFIDGIILSILICTSLYIINIKFAIEIGIIAGILNIIPYASLIVGIALAIISTLLDGEYVKMIYSVLSIFLFQQIDAIFISPKILGDVVKLNPAFVIIILLISSKLFGILGIILSIPIFSLIKIIFLKTIKLYKNKKLLDNF